MSYNRVISEGLIINLWKSIDRNFEKHEEEIVGDFADFFFKTD